MGFASLAPDSANLDWPTSLDSDGRHLLIYQPQVDSWQGNHLTATAAVTITTAPSSDPIPGIVHISAQTDVDKESRLVTLDDLRIDRGSFPSANGTEEQVLRVIRDSVGDWSRTISLDRLQASLAITQAETKTDAIPLKNTPSHIIVSTRPAVLVLIDGEPAYRPVPGAPFTRIINTPALILYDGVAQRFYLDGWSRWMTASSLDGHWTVAMNPPPALEGVRARLSKEEDRAPGDLAPTDATVPTVFIDTTPAELLQTRGTPDFASIPGTELRFVTNTIDNIFLDDGTQSYYVLLAGGGLPRLRSMVPGSGCLERPFPPTSREFLQKARKLRCERPCPAPRNHAR
jgi:hypothetical protein